MRILSGYMPATNGRAVVAGYDVFSQALAVRRCVGYLPENVPLYREMTVQSYLRFVAEVKGVPRQLVAVFKRELKANCSAASSVVILCTGT